MEKQQHLQIGGKCQPTSTDHIDASRRASPRTLGMPPLLGKSTKAPAMVLIHIKGIYKPREDPPNHLIGKRPATSLADKNSTPNKWRDPPDNINNSPPQQHPHVRQKGRSPSKI
ncbi:hypothetical protein Nepgr_021434 [Nepenthes gracilis]|uniref:Uncharacterized protein n=1 Tax=Nepenthes gracilis TaxID=150966 RepID=A0AAD3SWT1_NEPGR|nr:hypothetical protein Nepgr_021434 [Nepenthes gracilis]